MNRQEQLEKVRTACVKANLEISMCQRCEKTPPIHSDFCKDGLSHNILNRRIHLADVLLAIQIVHPKAEYRSENQSLILSYSLRPVNQPRVSWNLRKDSLEDQSDECVAFLADLLKD